MQSAVLAAIGLICQKILVVMFPSIIFKKICIVAQTIDIKTHVPCVSYYSALLDTRLK